MMLSIVDYVLYHILKLDNYGSRLEDYIVAHQPKTSGDVERLEKEFLEKLLKGYSL
jgi:hypothetical protein